MIRIFSVSMPRSGHHVAEMVLGRLFGDKFHYCEFYSIPWCCKTIPCARMDDAQKVDALVFMQKTHDHNLTDPIGPGFDGYAIQVREPVARMLSNYELHLQTENIEHSRSYQQLWIGLEAHYTAGFIKKWCTGAPDRLLLKYEQLLEDPILYYKKAFDHFRLPERFFDHSTILQAMKFSSDGSKPFRRREVAKSKHYDADTVTEFSRLVAPAAQTIGYSTDGSIVAGAASAQARRIFEFKELSNRRDNTGALKCLDEYLASPEAHVIARRWRANLLASMDQVDAAVADYAMVIEQIPTDALTYVNYAAMALKQNNFEQAKKLIASCLARARDKGHAADVVIAHFGHTDLAAPAIKLRADLMLSRDDVIKAFKLILGRDPENEQVIANHRAVGSLDDLRHILIKSDEFGEKYRSIGGGKAA